MGVSKDAQASWKAALLLSAAAMPALNWPAHAQSSILPPVSVEAPQVRRATRAVIAPRPQAAPRRTARPVLQQGQVGAVAARGVSATAGRTDTRDRVFATSQSTATKTSTPVLETPQSISTVTRHQLDEQNPQTVGNALRYTAGVLSEVDATSRYDSVFLRGFGAFGTATNFVSFLDGLKLPRGQAFAVTSIDAFLLDRIDVIKGPSAVLYGQISPGGLVNLVSRQPSEVPYNEARIEGGSFGRIQSGITSQGYLDAAKQWLYSISAIGRTSDTRYDGVEEQRVGVAPAITWRPDADTQLTISGFYQRDPKGGYFNSLYPQSLAPAAYRPYLNRNLNIGDPGFERFEREQTGVGYVFDRRLNDVVSVHSALRYSQVDTDLRAIQMVGPITAAGTIPRAAIGSTEHATGLAADNRLRFDFMTSGIDHTVLAGVDQQNARSSWLYQFGAASSLDVVNPAYNQPVGALAPFINNDQTLSQTGVYVQDQMKFGGFRLTLGTRHDWTEQKTDNRLNGTSQGQDSDKQTYRAGLLYLFDNGLAPYASYSTSFEPVVGVGSNGLPFAPTTGEQYEAGLKYKPTFADMLFTAAVFDLRQRNILTPSTVPGFSVQQGEVRSQGVELEARARVTETIEIIAASTFLDTRVTQSTDLLAIGKRPQAVPKHFESVWANYSFLNGGLAGLTIGGGVRSVGSSYGDDVNSLVSPGYVVFDAAVRYDLVNLVRAWKGAEVTLNVTNLFDKSYYTSCSSNFYCQFGNGRLVLAGLRYRW
ncbi:TonB-dependent siderophore receptor [uncultured Bradyrhizobium sp.]|uniref:TonB-dependent siderophore receptor n=1 Tax=uncultured Bradyrhizobium sp. TaxID=199684 RepID=UPI00263834CB|nr:TonB-dependent siderophore receptor [uncultured Bradyrhizobium sp.]